MDYGRLPETSVYGVLGRALHPEENQRLTKVIGYHFRILYSFFTIHLSVDWSDSMD